MNIGRNIQQQRRIKNVTQEELAAQLGVTAAAVSKWECGYTLPDIMMLCALADYFGVSTDELLGRTEKSENAVIVAETDALAKKIAQMVEKYHIKVENCFSAYRPALSYALAHECCRYIFIGLPNALPAVEINDTPVHINSIQSLGNTDAEILRGFEKICEHLDLILK